MIKKVIISEIKDYDKDKNGNFYKTKDGRNYVRRMIKVDGSNDILSGFKSKNNEGWRVGDEVNLNIEKVEKDGKTYWNFGEVKMDDRMMAMIEELNKRVTNLEKKEADKVRGFEVPERDESNTPDFDVPPIEEVPW